MRYRVITHLKGSKPIYAELQVEGELQKTPKDVLQDRTSCVIGNWIDGAEYPNPALAAPLRFCGEGEEYAPRGQSEPRW